MVWAQPTLPTISNPNEECQALEFVLHALALFTSAYKPARSAYYLTSTVQ